MAMVSDQIICETDLSKTEPLQKEMKNVFDPISKNSL